MLSPELMGRAVGNIIGFGIQGVIVYKVCQIVPPKSLFIAKYSTRTAVKLVRYTCKHHKRLNFTPDAIFADALEASLNAF